MSASALPELQCIWRETSIAQQQAQLAEAEASEIGNRADKRSLSSINKQMRYGQRLTMEDVDKVRWPEAAIPDGAFTSEEELFPKGPDRASFNFENHGTT